MSTTMLEPISIQATHENLPRNLKRRSAVQNLKTRYWFAASEVSPMYKGQSCQPPESKSANPPDRHQPESDNKPTMVPSDKMIEFEAMQDAIDATVEELSGEALKANLQEFREDWSGYEYLHLLNFHEADVPPEEMKGFAAMQEAIDATVASLSPEAAQASIDYFRKEWAGYSFLNQLNWYDSGVPLRDLERFRTIQTCIDAVVEHLPAHQAKMVLQNFRNESREYVHLKRLNFHDVALWE